MSATDYANELLDAEARYRRFEDYMRLVDRDLTSFAEAKNAYIWELANLARLAVDQLAESLWTARIISPKGVPVRAQGFPADAQWRWDCHSCAATGQAYDYEQACQAAWLHLAHNRVPREA
jgi:hypothetical protein